MCKVETDCYIGLRVVLTGKWSGTEACRGGCEVEIVNNARDEDSNTESEEADGCKTAYSPDGRVLGECGKVLLATTLLAVICECDNRKTIYFHPNKEKTQNKKILNYTSSFASQILKESIGVSDWLF